MRETFFPCNLSISNLSQVVESCNFFPSVANPKIFFIVDNKPALPGLEFPVIKYLTVLKTLDTGEVDGFFKHLKRLDNHFLVLIESYNEAALELLVQLQPEETYYYQQKLLCSTGELNIGEVELPSDILIRNFITGRDEDQYAEFYNQVLGFLAGKPVDRPFVDDIVARPSFDPKGYFIVEKKDHMVGFLSIEKEPWGEKGSGFGYIYQIGVAEPWRGSGLAEVLFEKARDFAIEYGINRIGVGVRKSNTTAVRFFEKHGFAVAYAVAGYLIHIDK